MASLLLSDEVVHKVLSLYQWETPAEELKRIGQRLLDLNAELFNKRWKANIRPGEFEPEQPEENSYSPFEVLKALDCVLQNCVETGDPNEVYHDQLLDELDHKRYVLCRLIAMKLPQYQDARWN